MTVETLLTQINAAYRGTDDDAPADGTPDFDLWLATANRKQNEWARDGKNTWQSLFEIREVGTVAAGTQVYDLDEEIILPANKVIVTTTGDQVLEYTISKPQERQRFLRSAYISGRDPQTLTFYDTITSDSQIDGGTISIAAYFVPEDLTSVSDVVSVDDPYWLVYAVASELAFNDLTYEDKYQDLNVKANNLWRQMSQNNRRGTSDFPRTARTNVNRIAGPSSERNRD